MNAHAIVDSSSATPEFKRDVLQFAQQGQASRVATARPLPPAKVRRLLLQLLSNETHLPIERVHIHARSGCSDFVGTVEVYCADGLRRFEFTWCCRWRAEQEGWTDYFGFPDQIRAAEEFDWRCFREWREMSATPAAGRSGANH